MTFHDWFAAQHFHWFTAPEFTRYFAAIRGGVRNSEPPMKLWANIVPTLRLADRLREHYCLPCVITSSYRSPSYNAAVGGAPGSMHMQFRALDIQIRGTAASSVHALLKLWRDQGRWKGGLGRYRAFTHIDTRGHNASW